MTFITLSLGGSIDHVQSSPEMDDARKSTKSTKPRPAVINGTSEFEFQFCDFWKCHETEVNDLH
jgi:hypothetical protein